MNPIWFIEHIESIGELIGNKARKKVFKMAIKGVGTRENYFLKWASQARSYQKLAGINNVANPGRD